MRKLTKEEKRDIQAIAGKRDRDIDFSDAPRALDWSGADIGKFHRPAKKPVTMRLDSDVVAWLKGAGPGYQTRANGLLRYAMAYYKSVKVLRPRDRVQRNSKSTRRKSRS